MSFDSFSRALHFIFWNRNDRMTRCASNSPKTTPKLNAIYRDFCALSEFDAENVVGSSRTQIILVKACKELSNDVNFDFFKIYFSKVKENFRSFDSTRRHKWQRMASGEKGF